MIPVLECWECLEFSCALCLCLLYCCPGGGGAGIDSHVLSLIHMESPAISFHLAVKMLSTRFRPPKQPATVTSAVPQPWREFFFFFPYELILYDSSLTCEQRQLCLRWNAQPKPGLVLPRIIPGSLRCEASVLQLPLSSFVHFLFLFSRVGLEVNGLDIRWRCVVIASHRTLMWRKD